MAKLMVQSIMKGRIEQERDHDQDHEELTLFRDLRKRQNERISSLMHCVSEEYDQYDTNGGNGKSSLYRIPSGDNEYGLEFMMETNKNDYDWLKTPPATPLFPSLEMEPIAQLVAQKEIPISQPISRFAGSDVEALNPKTCDAKPNHSISFKEKHPMRSTNPSHNNKQRPSIIKNTKQLITTKSNDAKIEHSTPQNQTNNPDFSALNVKKSIEPNETKRKPKTRGVTSSVRSRAAGNNMVELSNEAPPNQKTDQKSSTKTRGVSQLVRTSVESFMLDLELPNEAPPNLRTDERSNSTTRGRSTIRASTIGGSHQHHDPTPKACRPSRSPSPSVYNGGWNPLERSQKNFRTQKERFTNSERKTHFLGSKMVEKVMNARKSGTNHAEKETKTKPLKYR